MGYLYLIVAIISEVIATSALKETLGFSKLLPSLIVVIGYSTILYVLSFSLIPIANSSYKTLLETNQTS